MSLLGLPYMYCLHSIGDVVLGEGSGHLYGIKDEFPPQSPKVPLLKKFKHRGDTNFTTSLSTALNDHCDSESLGSTRSMLHQRTHVQLVMNDINKTL